MIFRILLFCTLICMAHISLIQSSALFDDYTYDTDFPTATVANLSPVSVDPYKFISLICQQRGQYSLKSTQKLCSNYLQFFKIQDQQQQQQQRGKRVGWTISV